MLTFIIYVLLFLGVGLMLTAAFGLFRFKGAASRLHPPTKASALGLSLILLASALAHAQNMGSFVVFFQSRELLAMVFIVLVSPLVGHNLLRALK